LILVAVGFQLDFSWGWILVTALVAPDPALMASDLALMASDFALMASDPALIALVCMGTIADMRGARPP